jgi:septum formation protein
LFRIFYYAGVMQITLASTSPRRRELVTLFGLAFQFISADLDESPRLNETPAELVRRLSRAKAETCPEPSQRIGARQFPDAIVIGADTVVSIDHTILGKPVDADDAVRMLTTLRHRPHVVYSGVTVMRGDQAITQVATTTVHMRNYSDEEIATFVATGEPLDKAAAYAIQNTLFKPVEYVAGCFANVMGLPLCHLYRALKAFGVQVDAPDRACQTYLQIVCPVARDILNSPIENC